MSDDDQNWIDALAGRETADSPTRREAEALREALRANAAPAAVSIGADPDRERALLARAVRAGLLPARPLRPRWPLALAAGVVLALGLGFAMHRLQISGNLIERGAEDGVVRLTAANPAALKQTILRELHAAGVSATGYEALNVHGIDADLVLPLSEPVREVLRAHGIAEPADGALRIEIRGNE